MRIIKQLIIFFRLKIQETWKGVLTMCFGYWCSLWIGYWVDKFSGTSFGDDFYVDYILLPALGLFIIIFISLILFYICWGIQTLIKWIKSNWEEAGRILDRKKENGVKSK